MTELQPATPIQTQSTAIAGSILVALAILPTQFSVGAGYDQTDPISKTAYEVQIGFDQSNSSGTSSELEFDDQRLSGELTAQMEELFERLVESQTAIEPEFFSALYENRSKMYTLF